jgi:glycosyltransferase involved in cell wall biosynthesis
MVSVIVPTRNSARTLEACLASIRAQQVTEIELIVVDNGSIDESEAIAQRYADVVVRHGPERSAQRNYGAFLAKGSYLLFVDSDMVLQPNVAAKCMTAIDETGSPAVIVPESTVGEGFWAACRALERSCYAGDDLIEAARFFRRDAFSNAGGFDEQLTGPEDWDLSARVSRGKKLPRAASQIIHDEGHLRIGDHLTKKRYYAASFRRYLQKHRVSPRRQTSFFWRTAFLRNWRDLAKHPVLTIGIGIMKSLELCVGAAGILASGRRQASVDQTPTQIGQHQ